MADTLRERCEAEAKRWCVCADDYTRRDRIDPTCRCDAVAEILEDFVRIERRRFAEKALRWLDDQVLESEGVSFGEIYVQKAIAAAEAEDA